MIKNIEEKIPSSSASALTYFLCKGSFLGIVTWNILNLAKTSSSISAILGSFIGIIPLLLILYILKNASGENIIYSIEDIFGNKIGKAINILISVFLIQRNSTPKRQLYLKIILITQK